MANFGKNWRPARPEAASAQLADRVDALRTRLRFQDPELVAARCGASYLTLGPGRGELHVPFWERVCILGWPELTASTARGEHIPGFHQALLLYYLTTADGAPVLEKWVSFADLPDGRMYNAAFQGYSGDEIARAFEAEARQREPTGGMEQGFRAACIACGGRPLELGGAAYIFQALPRVPLLVTYWPGDEDFPSTCKILFDASATHYLPTDVCAILGSMLAQRLMRSEVG